MGVTGNEAADVSGPVVVRLVRSEERAGWRHWVNAHHYLGFRPIVGESLW